MEDAPSSETIPAPDLSDQIAIEGLVDALFDSADARTFGVLNAIRNKVTGAN